jgi:hypothetical protein
MSVTVRAFQACLYNFVHWPLSEVHFIGSTTFQELAIQAIFCFLKRNVSNLYFEVSDDIWDQSQASKPDTDTSRYEVYHLHFPEIKINQVTCY